MTWGRGWQVGVRREIWAQEKAARQAALILKSECGTKHAPGTRADLCPSCIEHRRKENGRPVWQASSR